MSHFEIFGLYLVLNLTIALWLAAGVIRLRMSRGVSLGHGDDGDLLRAQRAHGNFIENAPLVLIGMISMMQLGTSTLMLHLVGALFVLARLAHAVGIKQSGPAPLPRRIGTVLTLLIYLILIVYILLLLFRSQGSYGVL